MGQYYKTCNIDKRQLLNPHDLGDGLKLMEFGMSGRGTLTALASLLVMDGQGVGPWAGNRIVIAGDYADEGRFVPKEFADINLYSYACAHDDGDEEADEAESGSAAKPKMVPFENATDAARKQLEFLQLTDVELRGGRTEKKEYQKLWVDKTFDQPEDVFEYLDATPQENLKFAMSEVTRTLRMNGVASDVAWDSAKDVQLFIDDASGRCTRIEVRWQPRNPDSRGITKDYETAMDFPATTAAVRKFLKVAKPAVPVLEHNKTARLK